MLEQSLLTNWQDKHAKLFDNHTILLTHKLNQTGLFTEDALAQLIDRCEPQHYNINTMGYDKNLLEWRAGEIGDLTGKQVIEAIRKGRMWMNLHRIMERDLEYKRVLDNIFDELEEKVPNLKTFKRNMTLLISSPNIQVYYHADIQGQSLWQLSGRKRVYVYPPTETFLSAKSLEKILLRETEEEVPYEPWFDDYAEIYDLEPGQMAHWPLYAPHRVENYDCLNISITTEHWTRDIWNAYAVNYGNGVLRRTLGFKNLSQNSSGFHIYPKAAAALLWKKLKLDQRNQFSHKVDFRVDLGAEKGMVDIAPYEKAA